MDFSIFLYSSNSKPPIQTTTQTNLVQRSDKIWPNFSFNQIHAGFMPVSCRIHAGFMRLYTYAAFMSDSCRIQLNSVLPFIYIDLRRFHAGFMHLYTYVRFMPDSVEFSFACQFCHSFTLSYVVFMPVSCRIHAFIKGSLAEELPIYERHPSKVK